jgi:hypothetical protein
LRVVLLLGSLPWSEEPRRIESVGISSTPMITTAASASSFGRFSTTFDQRAHTPVGSPVTGPDSRSVRRPLREITRMAMAGKPSSAGSRVSEASTTTATAIAAPTPEPDRKLICVVSMPSSAMQTVVPAKTTARPEVSRAWTTAFSWLRPARTPLRNRVTMNSA